MTVGPVSGNAAIRVVNEPYPHSGPMSESWSHLFREQDPVPGRDEQKDDFIRLLLDSMAEGLYVINRQGECIICNDRCVTMLGYKAKADILGENMHALIHHTRRDGSPYDERECPIYRAFRRGERVHVDNEVFWRQDGAPFDAEYSSYPLQQGGVVTGAVVTFFDVTNRRATEADLRLRTRAIEEATNGVIITDATHPHNPIVYVNSTFARLTGYAAEEVLGKNCRFLQGPATDRDALARIRQAIAEGRECREVLRNYQKDGSPFWNELSVSPVHDDDGRLTAFIGIQSDVTEREQSRAALEAAREKAESASRAKSEFLAHVSHELRSPMTAILGFTDLLIQQGLGADGRDYAQTIQRNGDYLLRLINDILDISKIEAGRLSVESEEVDLSQLIEEVRSLMTVKARERGVEFSVNCDTPVPALIMVDPIRLRQVLVNLLTNAFKFTDQGRVDLLLRYDPAPPPPPILEIAVQDTGIGIPEEAQKTLFEPFVQVASEHRQRREGTGLGLAISHRLVKAMGGELTLQSVPNQGSTFCARIPLESQTDVPLIDSLIATVHDPPPAEGTPVVLSGHILVADDRRDIRHLLKHFLTGAGATVEFAENGAEALHRLTQRDQQPEISLLLLDMQMPTMNGHEASKQLRNAGITIPIIALTANAKPSERAKCLAAGCDDFLTKPIDTETLLRTVARWESHQTDTPFG